MQCYLFCLKSFCANNSESQFLFTIVNNKKKKKEGEKGGGGGGAQVSLPSPRAPTTLEIMLNEKLYLIWVVLFHNTQSNRAVGARGRQEGPSSPNFLTANVFYNER